MALVDLWLHSQSQLSGKHIQQIIAFAGDGKMRDGNAASTELREFLSIVPSVQLRQYASDCLEGSFTDSGLALQEIVNQIGQRLGFVVEHGRYRGTQGAIGFDGIWSLPDERSIIVEVKTTDAYRIDLNTIAGYCVFRTKSATHSDANRPPVPKQIGQGYGADRPPRWDRLN